MLHELIASAALAASLLSPSPIAVAEDSTTSIPLVREELGGSYTLVVNQKCPDSHPYVYFKRWTGSLPEHVTFVHADGDTPFAAAVRITGYVTNWNTEKRYVSLDLRCTSDVREAATVSPF